MKSPSHVRESDRTLTGKTEVNEPGRCIVYVLRLTCVAGADRWEAGCKHGA
jgi:hypothetical protein